MNVGTYYYKLQGVKYSGVLFEINWKCLPHQGDNVTTQTQLGPLRAFNQRLNSTYSACWPLKLDFTTQSQNEFTLKRMLNNKPMT